MIRTKNKFKKGAASFYIVAFSTLILMIIATSFAVVIISEIERTSNEDLSQSAYDSALAGVEDAKLAIFSYQNCLLNETSENKGECDREFKAAIQDGENCNAVSDILGRNGIYAGSIVEEYDYLNNMQQSYTCVTISVPSDYRSELSSKNTVKVMRAKFDGISASEVKKVKISWFSNKDNKEIRYNNVKDGNVVFEGGNVSVPPTIWLAMVQTSKNFTLSDFDFSHMDGANSTTDRGMVYLVPTDKSSGGATKIIDKSGMLKSNDKTSMNSPYLIYCENDSDFVCSAEIELPDPVGGERSDETFMFAVGLPYGEPDTDFALEFFCDSECGEIKTSEGVIKTTRAGLKNVQIEVDSTGKANDLYRRVVTRLEDVDDFALSVMGPLVLFGDSDGDSLTKDMTVLCEYSFGNTTCEQ